MLGIANPLGLLTLASVAVLIVLTQLRRRSHVSTVSSLILWKQLPERPLERQRFRPDLLFVLPLLPLLALVGGYSLPWIGGPGGDAASGLAIVLDVSASMQVREAAGSRFALARRRLDELVGGLPSAAPVMIVAAADRPRVALRWTTDRGRITERLAALEPLDTPTDLAPAAELALGEAPRRRGAPAPASGCSRACRRRRAGWRGHDWPGSTGSRSAGVTTTSPSPISRWTRRRSRTLRTCTSRSRSGTSAPRRAPRRWKRRSTAARGRGRPSVWPPMPAVA